MQSNQEIKETLEQDKTSTITAEEVAHSSAEVGNEMIETVVATKETDRSSPEIDKDAAESKKGNLAEHDVIREMIQTERTFNETLTFLDSLFAQNELVKDIPILEEFKSLVPPLKVISDKLLGNIEQSILLPKTDLHALRVQRFQLLKAFFKIYPKCCELYSAYVKEEKTNPLPFANINTYTRLNHPRYLDLPSLLIQPFQRGPRYLMLATAAIGDRSKLSANQIEVLEGLISYMREQLKAANSTAPAPKKPYEFGDWLLRPAYHYFTQGSVDTTSVSSKASAKPAKEEINSSQEQKSSHAAAVTTADPEKNGDANSDEAKPPKSESPRQGVVDYTRGLVSYFWSKQPEPPSMPASSTTHHQGDIDEAEFVVVAQAQQ
ncbi:MULTISPECIES: RhoGEF domain-containing protein [Legionella]|uniref:RhoGEF domain protein n=1 Tax=Legionella maceachernii TaxID=466 RepID=A0A0W0W4G1_9GAMM|nr:RhoGEF domain-containing protein [Legionella maceachernii]KTD27075.1 RhoGEF domain protein [Legionella maceachernii]SKA04475.1 RhoGEF domain-containing protein [Legionella maceachernii]SUP00273.1 RhoGEF domain [Legionella maceachernii]